MKKFINLFLAVTMILTMFSMPVFAEDNITIYVNEQMLQCDVAPYIENGRTMVPMRKIFEALDAKVDWDGTTQTITATKDNTIITLQINNSTMYNNGIAETLDVAPVIVNSSTFVPIRVVSQSLNASVEWNDFFSTVYINSLNAFQRDTDWANVYMAVQPAGYTMYENISKDAMPKSIICIAGQVTDVMAKENEAYLVIENAFSLKKEKIIIDFGLSNDLSLEEINKKFKNKKIILIGQYLGLENNLATIMPAEEISILITQNGVLQDIEYYYTENYFEETYAVCSPDGRRAYVLFSDLDYFVGQGWVRPTLTLYSSDGQIITVYEEEMEYYLDTGWSTEAMVTMYANDGRTISVPQSEVEAYKTVGWYIEPVTQMYALDGRTIYVPDSEVEAHKNVGWYLTPVTTMYAPDGRTIIISQDDVYAYQNVGWYETEEQAQAANKVTNTSSGSSNPSSDGYYYRTPTGKKYHLDPNCGGKNSRRTTNISGLSPCSKCAR